MKNLGRIDRIVLFLATSVLSLSGLLIFGYDYLAQLDLATGEAVGEIVEKTGGVRKKTKSSFRWQAAGEKQGLAFGDSLYVEPGGNTKVRFNGASLNLSEKTLVNFVFRKKYKMVNIQFGSVEGSLQAGEKLVLVGKSGKPIELTSKNGGRFQLKAKADGQMQLSSDTEGVKVSVGGVQRSLSSRKPLALQANQAIPQKQTIELLRPWARQNFIVTEAQVVKFQWKTSRAVYPKEAFEIQFSRDPDFRRIFVQKKIVGRSQVKVRVKGDDHLYWGVRGDADWNVSESRPLIVTRIRPPKILRPTRETSLQALPNQPLVVPFQFDFAPYSRRLRWQVSKDSQFQNVEYQEDTSSSQVLKAFLPGKYFLRAKSIYPDQSESSWGRVEPFAIKYKVPSLAYDLFPHPDTTVMIPNKDYPKYLYNTNDSGVIRYLKKRRFMSRYFIDPRARENKVRVFFDPGYESEVLVHWPQEKLKPGTYHFKYRLERPPVQPGPWSKRMSVKIVMESPYRVKQKVKAKPRVQRFLDAQLAWTPILFAKKYEVEMKSLGSMAPARRHLSKSSETSMRVLNGANYKWRVRARNRRGRVISGFSPWYGLKATLPDVRLAKNKTQKPKSEKEPERKVASRIRKKMKQEKRRPFHDLSGYSFWVGAGYNLIDYKQTVENKSDFNYSDARGPSQFLEFSYLGRSGFGGALNYKVTPGKVKIENRSIDRSDSNWRIISAEGKFKKDSGWTTPMGDFIYGVRAGVQHHSVPFVHLDQNSELILKDNTMVTASLGTELEFWRRSWRYSMLMRYQMPLSASGDGGNDFTITPKLAFDGSLGVSYLLGPKMKLGLFWYGQMHQYDFVFSDGSVENTGDQSLFFSNIDFRFGFDF